MSSECIKIVNLFTLRFLYTYSNDLLFINYRDILYCLLEQINKDQCLALVIGRPETINKQYKKLEPFHCLQLTTNLPTIVLKFNIAELKSTLDTAVDFVIIHGPTTAAGGNGILETIKLLVTLGLCRFN
ncbi:hypothetical protein CCFV1_ORF095 [Cotesia congregata filamentous virus 1]|uniref:Uncharacterized protein n=1 Tax=Cotesia congregata filamentous virus 1 TaxID=3064291 RepID=A0ABC8QJS9_9VIRU|nr:hypothetical protein CCFV1_ORF095 [Cotesia congregata filamentous virus 1]